MYSSTKGELLWFLCWDTQLCKKKESSDISAGEKQKRSIWAVALQEPAFDLLFSCLVFLYVVYLLEILNKLIAS